MAEFEKQVKKYKEEIETSLSDFYPQISGEQKKVVKAARYSLMAGGKRIRPVLCLAVADMFKSNREEIMPFACAIEMIHTFSLIHDDLPGMDNDDLRRGKPTCHKKYSEAIAILAGDSLLNKAYEIMLYEWKKRPSEGKTAAILFICKSVGEDGMIGGQTIDVESENKLISEDLLLKMHSMKTGALLKAPIVSSAFIAGAKHHEIEFLERFAHELGLAFQIRDDILDVESTTQMMGKTVGKDEKYNKSTYVSLFGLEGAKEKLDNAVERSSMNLQNLKKLGYSVDFLHELAYYLLKRKN